MRKTTKKRSEAGEVFFLLSANLPRFLYLILRMYGSFTLKKRSYMRTFRKTVLESSIERTTALRIVKIQRKNMKIGIVKLLRGFID